MSAWAIWSIRDEWPTSRGREKGTDALWVGERASPRLGSYPAYFWTSAPSWGRAAWTFFAAPPRTDL
jgi:hypothetical protein